MNYYLSVLSTAVCFLILFGAYWLWVMNNRANRPGKTPQRHATMFDVRRLLQEGDRDSATKLYIQIFKVSPKQARKDIEDLERNLKV